MTRKRTAAQQAARWKMLKARNAVRKQAPAVAPSPAELAKRQRTVAIRVASRVTAADAAIHQRDLERERLRRLWGAVMARDIEERRTELDRLAERGLITLRHRDIGRDVALLWHETGVEARITAGLQPGCGSGSPGGPVERATMKQMAARAKWAALIQRVGPAYWPHVDAVCIRDQEPASIPALRAGLEMV